MKTKTVLLLGQKGGCGKTTLADEITFSLWRSGVEAQCVDVDQQGGSLCATIDSNKTKVPTVQIIDTAGALREDMPELINDADCIVLPVLPSMRDIPAFLRTYDIVKTYKKRNAIIIVAVNRATHYTNTRDFLEWLQSEKLDAEIVNIVQSELFLQASGNEKSVIDYSPRSSAAESVKSFVNAVRKAIKISPEC